MKWQLVVLILDFMEVVRTNQKYSFVLVTWLEEFSFIHWGVYVCVCVFCFSGKFIDMLFLESG